MPNPIRDPSTTLRDLLESAGVQPRLEFDPEGSAIATFTLEASDGEPVRLAAGIRVLELRITAHRVLPQAGEDRPAAWFTQVNEAWGFGRAYEIPDTREVDASVGMYLGGVLPSGENMRHTLVHLGESIALLRAGQEPMYAPLGMDSRSVIRELSEQLTSLNLRFQVSDGVVFSGIRDGDLKVRLEYVPVPGSAIRVYAFLADPPAARPAHADSVVHALNRSLSYGTFAYPEQDEPHYFMLVPLAWLQIDRTFIDWVIGKASFVLRYAAQQLDARNLHGRN